MRKMLLLIGIIALLLTGCAPKEKVIYVTKVKTKYIVVPRDFYVDDINIPNFPSMRVYLKANPYQREKLLINHILDLYNCIGKYKLKLKAIYNFDRKMQQINKSQESH